MLRKFSRTIQVNVISNGCYSGIFAEKFRIDNQVNRWVQAASGSHVGDKAWPAAKSSGPFKMSTSSAAGFVFAVIQRMISRSRPRAVR